MSSSKSLAADAGKDKERKHKRKDRDSSSSSSLDASSSIAFPSGQPITAPALNAPASLFLAGAPIVDIAPTDALAQGVRSALPANSTSLIYACPVELSQLVGLKTTPLGAKGLALVKSIDTNSYFLVIYTAQRQEVQLLLSADTDITLTGERSASIVDAINQRTWLFHFATLEQAQDFLRSFCMCQDDLSTFEYLHGGRARTAIVHDLSLGAVDGPAAAAGDHVKVKYSVFLTSPTHPIGVGERVVSKESKKFVVGEGSPGLGIDRFVIGMRKKGVRFCVVPPSMLDEGTEFGPLVPAHSTLLVELSLASLSSAHAPDGGEVDKSVDVEFLADEPSSSSLLPSSGAVAGAGSAPAAATTVAVPATSSTASSTASLLALFPTIDSLIAGATAIGLSEAQRNALLADYLKQQGALSFSSSSSSVASAATTAVVNPQPSTPQQPTPAVPQSAHREKPSSSSKKSSSSSSSSTSPSPSASSSSSSSSSSGAPTVDVQAPPASSSSARASSSSYDLELEQLLQALELVDFLPNFKKEGVHFSDLAHLDVEELKSLVPQMGPRARFLRRVQELQSNKSPSSKTASVGASASPSAQAAAAAPTAAPAPAPASAPAPNAAELARQYELGKQEALAMAREKIDQMKDTANSRFVELNAELEQQRRKNEEDVAKAREMIGKLREELRTALSANGELQAQLTVLAQEKDDLFDKSRAYVAQIKQTQAAAAAEQARSTARSTLDLVYTRTVEHVQIKEFYEGEHVLALVKKTLKAVALELEEQHASAGDA